MRQFIDAPFLTTGWGGHPGYSPRDVHSLVQVCPAHSHHLNHHRHSLSTCSRQFPHYPRPRRDQPGCDIPCSKQPVVQLLCSLHYLKSCDPYDDVGCAEWRARLTQCAITQSTDALFRRKSLIKTYHAPLMPSVRVPRFCFMNLAVVKPCSDSPEADIYPKYCSKCQ